MSTHHHPHKFDEECNCIVCKPFVDSCPCDGCEGLRALAGDPAQKKPKPPTQVAGVQGIAPERITMNDAPITSIPWQYIAGLPPFQMYAAERLRNTSGKDSMEHAADFIKALGAGQDVFDAYAAWHEAKGYWPGETAMGQAVNSSV